MNSFERGLFAEHQIPLHEASAFFIGARRPLAKVAGAMDKTAGWQDPPDDSGALEGQFAVPLEQAVGLMGKCAMYVLRLLNAGLVYGQSLRGPMSSAVRDAVRSGEWEHKDAFEYLVERMSVLAGAPHIPDPDMPPPSTEPVSVAQRMIRAEQEMIQAYKELLCVLGENPMRCHIKRFMGVCQRHIDQYWKLFPPTLAPPAPAAVSVPDPAPVEPSPEEALADVEGTPEVPPADVKTAAARMVKWAKEAPTDEELREAGRQSAVRTIAAEHGREAARRGERAGRTAGMLAGAAGGGVLGHALGKGHPGATLGGAALGGFAGRALGGELGTEADIARAKSKKAEIVKAASAMVSWVKKADEIGSSPTQEAPMASPTDTPELAPVNYLQAETIGQQLQNNNEARFYKQRAIAAEQAAQQAQADAAMQVQQMQQEAAQAQYEASTADQKVKAALDQVMKAKEDALKQTETAARMRIGQQNLRMKLLELAAQDPDMQAAMDLAQTTGQGTPLGQPMGSVMAPDAGLNAGPPGAPMGADPSAAMNTPPGAAPPAGSPDMNANAGGAPGPDPSTMESTFTPGMVQPGNAKIGSAHPFRKAAGLLGAGIGAGLGGIDRAVSTQRGIREGVTPLQTRISALEGAQDGGYAQAAALASARKGLADRELAVAFPNQALLRNTGAGLVRGAILGDTIENKGRALYNVLSQ